MSNEVVIFGTAGLSSLAWYALTHDSEFTPIAFTVDAEYLRSPIHEGLPVIPFDQLALHYAPAATALLVPLGYRRINGLRRTRYEQAKAQGYRLIRYVSSCAFTWPDLRLGENCLIYEAAIIQPFSCIGDNVIIRSGAHISHHCTIADHAFVAAGATVGGNVDVGEQAFIGLGAVVRDGIRIAERSFIGAGAVIVADTAADGVYVGNPGRQLEQSALEVTGG